MQSGFPVELIQRLSGATDREYHVSLRDVYRGGAECSTVDSASASTSIHPRTFMAHATLELNLVKLMRLINRRAEAVKDGLDTQSDVFKAN